MQILVMLISVITINHINFAQTPTHNKVYLSTYCISATTVYKPPLKDYDILRNETTFPVILRQEYILF